MKKKLQLFLSIIAIVVVAKSSNAQIAWYGADGSINPSPTETDSNLSATGISNGPGLGSIANPNYFGVTQFDAANTNLGDAQVDDDYVEWSIGSHPGYELEVTQVEVMLGVAASGPNKFSVLYSTDGFATPGITLGTDTITSASQVFNFNSLSINSGSGGTISFRLYAWGAGSSNGYLLFRQNANWSSPNISEPGMRIHGNANAASGGGADIFISQFIEDPNVIELYNNTGASVDLADYRLVMNQNGGINSPPTWITSLPTYTLNDQSTVTISGYVFGTPDFSPADITNASTVSASNSNPSVVWTWSSGNDAFKLQKNVNGTWVTIDVIGDSAPPFPAGPYSDLDNKNIERNVCAPNTTWTPGEWNGLSNVQGNAAGLGSHTCPVILPVLDSLVLSDSVLCVDMNSSDTLQVNYYGNGSFNTGNTFSVELSDSAGSFNSPTVIGSLNDTDTIGIINCVIPSGLSADSGYKVRIISSDPVVTGAEKSVHIGIIPSQSSSITDATCGNSDGSIDLTVSGGVTPYVYSWSTSATTEDLANVTAGNYTVTVNDSVGCSSESTYNVSNISGVTSTSTITDVTCHGGSTGSIDVTASSGTLPYSYSWSNNATTEDLTNITAGTYSLTITDSNGCVDAKSFTVSEPTALQTSGGVSGASCNGASDGSIDLTISGGTSPYTYTWSTSATTEDVSGLPANDFSVTVTDDNGCTKSDTFTVSEPQILSLTEDSVTDVLCNGGSDGAVAVSVTGGTSPYTYQWSNSATTEDLTGLSLGSYSVTVTDDNGCTANLSSSVNEPIALSMTATVTDVTCYGDTNGSIDLVPAGGVLPYSYSWSNTDTTEDISNVGADDYTVTLTDSNGCQLTLTDTVSEPLPLALTDTVVHLSCYESGDGAITVDVDGGTVPYSYAWSSNSTDSTTTSLQSGEYSMTVTDQNNCILADTFEVEEPTEIQPGTQTNAATCYESVDGTINITSQGGYAPYSYQWNTGDTTTSLTGGRGTYYVTVTDSTGCQVQDTAIVTSPDSIEFQFSVTDIPCSGCTGEITASSTGGTPPMLYTWSNGQNGSVLNTTQPGVYTVSVDDANGCTGID